MKKRKSLLLIVITFTLFVLISYIFNLEAGKTIGNNFSLFSLDILKLFPPAFILVGLFTVWVKKETVEKFFGEASGTLGYLAALLLAFTTLYPFILVLPMAGGLYKKGAKLSIILTYLGASAICRIPMTIFEASFLGLKFTIVRYIVSLPLIVLSSLIIEKNVKR